jgi:uncharacterized beta-barrel protein YwiB (DUF1934 family)
MNKDVLITIRGEQRADGQRDFTEMTVTGRMRQLGGHYFLHYRERQEHGFADHRVVLKFEGQDRVTMQRVGQARSRLMIERGRRHICRYGTGYGDLLIGISGRRITGGLGAEGGAVEFSYVMDIDSQTLCENKVHITVKEC